MVFDFGVGVESYLSPIISSDVGGWGAARSENAPYQKTALTGGAAVHFQLNYSGLADEFFAVGQGAHLAGGAEVAGEVLDVAEAEGFGDFVNGHLGFDEELGDFIGADAADFCEDGAAEFGAEAFFEEAAGEAGCAGDFADVDVAFSGVGADEAKGFGDAFVFDGDDVGGAADDDVCGADDDAFLGGFGVHEGVEGGGGFVAGGVEVNGDTGEGGVGEAADDFVVIGADDAEFVWDGDACDSGGFGDLAGAVVVAGHEADGFGEGLEPAGHGGAFAGPGGIVGGMGRKVGALEAGFLETLGETEAAGFGPGEVFAGFLAGAAEGEAFEAAADEVFGGHLANGFGVCDDVDEARNFCAAVADDDGGDAKGEDFFDFIDVAKDDAVWVEGFEFGPDFFEAAGFPIE